MKKAKFCPPPPFLPSRPTPHKGKKLKIDITPILMKIAFFLFQAFPRVIIFCLLNGNFDHYNSLYDKIYQNFKKYYKKKYIQRSKNFKFVQEKPYSKL